MTSVLNEERRKEKNSFIYIYSFIGKARNEGQDFERKIRTMYEEGEGECKNCRKGQDWRVRSRNVKRK